MRSLRSRKYRKKYRKLIVLAQILAIWYALVISTAVLTSDTFAFFSDSDSTKIAIKTGEWWDGSQLEFVEKPNTKNIKACAPTDLEIKVRNKGFKMGSKTEYEIYYVENGNPKQNGQIVSEGVIEPLGEGKSITLTYEALENGSYMFKVFQVPGYKDDFADRKEIWSTKYMTKCLEEEEAEEEEDLDEEVEMEEVEEDKNEEKDQKDQSADSEIKSEAEPKADEKKESSKEEQPKEEPKKEESQKEEAVVEEKATDDSKVETKQVLKQAKEEKEAEEDSSEEGDEK